MRNQRFAPIVWIMVISVMAPITASGKPVGAKDRTLDEQRFDRKGPFKQMRQKGPMAENRKGDPPKPFLMAGDPRFEQMLKLALVDEDKLQEAMKRWPRMQQMPEAEKERFAERVSLFRDKLRDEALQEAQHLGLNIREDQKMEYFRSYWTSRMQMEQEIRQEAKEKHQAKMEALHQRLKQEWSGQ